MKTLPLIVLFFIMIGAALVGQIHVATGNTDSPAREVRLPGTAMVIEAAFYPSIQAALDALPASGGSVHLPPGTFEIMQPLTISVADVLLEGAGTATHIKNVNKEGQSAIILCHPSREEDRNAELWRIRLANFRLTGNEASGHGIEARRINEVFIEGVTVSDHGGDGIRLHYCYEDPRICDSLITYNKKTGVNLVGCHDIVVSANQFEENHDAIHCADGFNLCMTGNNLDDHLGDGIVIENTYGSVVSGNMIEECNGTAIVLDRDCYGITLSANVIAHNMAGGIDLRDAHGCAVSANTFTIVRRHALRIGPDSGRITVCGNNFSDSYIGAEKIKRAADDREATGMTLEGTADVAVVGNLFASVTPKAMGVQGRSSTRILFGYNLLRDAGSDADQLGDSLVEGNLVR
ncbi:MAG: right-handed parallel beta-helix repeat-containing protein [Phycisphaerales bacterium]|nr:MAG: right-handed parallel beta-helix repeat-containing protein [Phycisphaerales bacterium]